MILCIDDDPLTRATVTQVLSQAGHACRAAADAEEAMQLVEDDPPDLILLDLGLPDCDGFELYERIRNAVGHQHTPVIVLSGSTTPFDIRRALGMGAEDYLVKPVVPPLLIAKISQVYERHAASTPALSATLSDAPPEVGLAALNSDNLMDKYVLLELLGGGGMGEVRKAWDTTLRTYAALKFLRPGVDPLAIERLYREAQIVVRLHHEHICRVYDLRKHDGQHYIAMQYIEGHNADCRFEFDTAARIVAAVARAVDHAHDEGVIHRDVKPANIILDTDGKPWITDFGISMSTAKPGRRLTPSGLVVGSPCYLAPELLDGADADRRSDVYALGATLYHMCVGRPPYDEEGVSTRQIFRDIAVGRLTRPGALVVGLPPALDDAIMRAMAHRSDRFPTAMAFALELERALPEQKKVERPSGRWRFTLWK